MVLEEKLMKRLTIDEYANEQAPANTEHDKAFRAEILKCFETYRVMDIAELSRWQKIAQKNYRPTHSSVAACLVLQALISDRIERTMEKEQTTHLE